MSEETNPGRADHTVTDAVLLESYWKYFELQSQQRLQMINFYITIEVVLIGAFFTTVNLLSSMRWTSYVVCIGILLTSLIFWRLDVRSRYLIRWCNECIMRMEERYADTYPEKYQLLNHSLNEDKKLKFKDSYTRCFLCYYFSIGGFAGVMIVLLAVGKI